MVQRHDRPILFIFIYKLTTSPLPRPKRPTRSSLSLLSSNLWLSPVQNLQEFSNSMPHSRVHVCFRTLDVVMEVIAEELDTVDCGNGLGGVGEMSWCEDCCQLRK
jgi:hypothetical protein